MTILVTTAPERNAPGAVPTVPVGRRLVDRLLTAGERARVLTPGSEAVGWPDGAEVVEGDVTRPAESPAAFLDIERMFLAGAAPETVRELVDLAEKGGVRRIVVLSSHGPEFEIEHPPETWFWLAIERAVEASSAEWTHVRPEPVMASTLVGGYPPVGSAWAESIRAGRAIREPHGHVRYPCIDENDLAAVVAAALLEDGYAGSILEPTGDAISPRERVRLIGEAIGREIRFEELTPGQARDHWRGQGWPEDTIEVTLWTQAQFLTHPPQPNPTVQRVLGRPARTYSQWLADHVEAFR